MKYIYLHRCCLIGILVLKSRWYHVGILDKNAISVKVGIKFGI